MNIRSLRDAILLSLFPTLVSVLGTVLSLQSPHTSLPSILNGFVFLWVILGFALGCYFCKAQEIKYLASTVICLLVLQNLAMFAFPTSLIYVFVFQLPYYILYALIGWGIARLAKKYLKPHKLKEISAASQNVVRRSLCLITGAYIFTGFYFLGGLFG